MGEQAARMRWRGLIGNPGRTRANRDAAVDRKRKIGGRWHQRSCERAMRFLQFTRGDDTPVLINAQEVVACAPVPADSRLEQGTRITFKNGGVQDVKELIDEVIRRLTADA
jgi:hypothetical protein